MPALVELFDDYILSRTLEFGSGELTHILLIRTFVDVQAVSDDGCFVFYNSLAWGCGITAVSMQFTTININGAASYTIATRARIVTIIIITTPCSQIAAIDSNDTTIHTITDSSEIVFTNFISTTSSSSKRSAIDSNRMSCYSMSFRFASDINAATIDSQTTTLTFTNILDASSATSGTDLTTINIERARKADSNGFII